MTTVAIIGAGLSGLVVARRLRETADVVVFEKSRGAGGRISTRYAGDYEFDHGAQFFTARTPEFQQFLQPMIEQNAIANWRAQFVELDRDSVTASRSWGDRYPHFVGTPRMNAVGKYLSAGLDISYATEVARVVRSNGRWTLFDTANDELGPFDWLVLAMPAAQTQHLAAESPEVVSLCRTRVMRGCFALMLGFPQPLELPWQAALVRGADISWISVNSSKPGRSDAFTLLVHSTNAWADAHMDNDIELVLEHMIAEASEVTGKDLGIADHRAVHRWRYANIDSHRGPSHFIDREMQLGVCGDWLVRGKIEAAFTSANELCRNLPISQGGRE